MTGEAINLFKVLRQKGSKNRKSHPYAKVGPETSQKLSYRVDRNEVNAKNQHLERWAKNQIWPMGVISKYLDERKMSQKLEYITSSRNSSKLDPPRDYSQLEDEKFAYFAGIAAGDGGFKGPNIWSVVDGGKPEELKDSKKFIEKISKLIQELFGIPEKTCCISERGNRVELKIANKWFCQYIRHCFNLPKSYKKGELSRPEIYSSKELTGTYWRGVFDTDGHIAKESYRTSMASATEVFADQCKSDLEKLDIIAKKRSRSEAYHLRIPGRQFESFCNKIGFSHPRKRKELLAKLEKGSRNYTFEGRNNEMIEKSFFDLTRIEDLRVRGLGSEIKSHRERNNLYQRELAEKHNISKNQVFCWENENYAAPITFLEKLYDSKIKFLQVLAERDLDYKVGVRGTENSLIKIPVEIDKNIDELASKIISSEKELRIQDRNDKVAERIEGLFEVEIRRDEYNYYSNNWTLIRFFSEFYNYEKEFASKTPKEIEKLKERLRLDLRSS